MKFIYGKQDFHTIERGQEICYLLTNGLGGFSSSTAVNSVTRNDHSFFMAAIKAPNHRYNMVHRLKETVKVDQGEYHLSTQQFADGRIEAGFEFEDSFSFEDIPRWDYRIGGVEITRETAMVQDENTVAVRYSMKNSGAKAALLTVTPFFQFVKKGEDLSPGQRFFRRGNCVESENLTLHFSTNGRVVDMDSQRETYHYAYDVRDGRRERGTAVANHKIECWVLGGEEGCLELIYSMKPVEKCGKTILDQAVSYRKSLEERAGFEHPLAIMLAKSANQFITRRESTGGMTILAGYPFFEDWGRDTMIAMLGCGLSTGQYDISKSILRTFMDHESQGLMPNLFPEGGLEPVYNTVDAALLFINAVYLYYGHTKDLEFLREAYPVMERIIDWYQKGTAYGIHMDRDGLIMAGEGFDQVTWMDVRVGEILPTPRHGKPVEINAYWYNALKILGLCSGLLRRETAFDVELLASRVRESFVRLFWMEEKGCLRDVVSGKESDQQLRCNQIWAVSLPFSILDREKEKKLVETVFETLYTPYGLRTLDPSDREFKGFYGGCQLDRDLAYHQGTVWPFPLGAYYLAYLKVHDYEESAIYTVLDRLEILECALREGCCGQLPEIYDGKNPGESKGCFAQAWSVGELLRVFEVIETWKREKGTRK